MVSLRRPRILRGKWIIGDTVAALSRLAGDLRISVLDGRHVRSILIALGLIAAMTLLLIGVTSFIELRHVSSAYLIPVLIAAIRLGMIPALVVACGGVGASAFFFYPPIYDFRVHNPEQLLDLPLFVIVAMVTSQLAARAQGNAKLAQDREAEVRALYAFSRRLAVTTDAAEISAAIQDHLSSITGRRVVYFEAGAPSPGSRHHAEGMPEAVARAVREISQLGVEPSGIWIDDERTWTRWLLRPVSLKNAAFGSVAIHVGRVSGQAGTALQHRIDAALSDAAATLERLDVASAIGEAKLRAEAETLRAALIGSVSHGLRTPLASIMGSASILVEAPALAREPRLASLAGIIRDEAERLNGEIQRLLEASRITSAGVRPHLAWADVADIVNAAVASQRRSLIEHRVAIRIPNDLPLVHVDAVLIEQALGQVLDNAAKYSPKNSTIQIEGCRRNGDVCIVVSDQGAGLSLEERTSMFDRFYRGSRTATIAAGSGLGLWIAHAFVVACGGSMDANSEGADLGTTVIIALPGSAGASGDFERAQDE
jgi:two-component system sensor histidine kinase KdpD